MLEHLKNYRKLKNGDYEFDVVYDDDKDLDDQVYGIWTEVHRWVDMRNCFVEGDFWERDRDRSW